MADMEKVVGHVLADRRRRAGLTQEALAEACDLHTTYISQLERGLKSPTLRVLFRIATAVGISSSGLIRAVERELSHPASGSLASKTRVSGRRRPK